MSKLTKLLNNPKGFVADYVKKNQNKFIFDEVVKHSSSLNFFVNKYGTSVVKNKKNVPNNISEKVSLSSSKKVSSTTKPSNTTKSNNTSPVMLKYHVNFFKKHIAILHSGEGLKAGLAHLKLWIPTFIESNIEFIILVRDIALFNALKIEYPWINIAYAKRPIDIEELIVKLPFVNSIFYPSSTGNNIHLVRFSYLDHIFIGHGDSDKASSAHKGLRLYDEVWTAGQAHIDRFANADFNSNHIVFKKVGRPNSFNVINDCKLDWFERVNNILYLPTWEGFMEEANYSSIHISSEIMQLIADKFTIKISAKYHPLTGSRSSAYKTLEQQLQSSFPDQMEYINIIDKTVTLDSIVSQNNIFICDMSAVISECLAANGPIFVYIPKDKALNIAASNMSYEDYCYAFSDINELEELMTEVLSGNDYLAKNRKNAINYLIGYNETLNKEFVKSIKSLCEDSERNLPSRHFDF